MKESYIFQARTKEEVSTTEKEEYPSMFGSIIFLMVKTRPDITFATSIVSRFAKNPGHQHIEVVKTILQYHKSLRDHNITYNGQDEIFIDEYSDSN